MLQHVDEEVRDDHGCDDAVSVNLVAELLHFLQVLITEGLLTIFYLLSKLLSGCITVKERLVVLKDLIIGEV